MSEVSSAKLMSDTYSTIPLVPKLLAESSVAVIAAALVSPFISIIDVSIFLNGSGKQKLGAAVLDGFKTLLTRPIYFVRQPSFYIVWGVYSGTYIVANSIQVLCDHKNIPWFYPKFVGTSFANVTFSVLKDMYLTKRFGSGSARKVPLRSFGLYTVRDSMTIFASFNLPCIVSGHLINMGLDKSYAETGSQLIAPCAIQALSSPLHLLGMDLYNNPSSAVKERSQFIRKEYVATTLARMGRIFPAFGIGGVTNKWLREKAKTILTEYYKKD